MCSHRNTCNSCGFTNDSRQVKCRGAVVFSVISQTGQSAGVNSSAFIGPRRFDDSQWHHAVGVYNATTGRVQLYVDGDLIGTSTGSVTNVGTNDLPLRIGGGGTTIRNFKGLIDEVAMYNRTLSETEIEAIASNGLVGHWPFDGNAIDATGNGHDGNALGATLTADRNGTPNSAYEFASGGHIRVPHDPQLNLAGNASIALWVNQQNIYSGAAAVLLHKGRDVDNT